MNDPEFIMLKNRFLLVLIFAILFTIPIFFIFKNKYSLGESTSIQNIRNQDNTFVWITKENCKECIKYEKVLKSQKISYYKIKETNIEELKELLNLSKEEIAPPMIVYIEKGNMISFLTDLNQENLIEFINQYKK